MANEIKKAICSCGKQWLWDWDNDVFCYESGKEISSQVVESGKSELCIYTCECGKINAVVLMDDDGQEVMDGGNFVGINWDAEENSF